MRKTIRTARRIPSLIRKMAQKIRLMAGMKVVTTVHGRVTSIEDNPLPEDEYKKATADYPEIYRDPYPPYFK